MLDVGEAERVVGNISRKAIEAEVDDLLAEGPYGDGVTQLVKGDGDRDEDEERRLIDQGAILHREVAVPQFLAALHHLVDDADADDHVKQAEQRKRTEQGLVSRRQVK